MTSLNQIQILVLAGIAGLSLIGCGAQTVSKQAGSTDYASTAVQMYSGQAIARCSHDVANFPNLGVRLMSTELQHNQGSSFYYRLQFDRFLDGFNSANQAIEIWSTSVDSQGNRRPPQRVSFQIERKLNGAFQRVSPYTYNDLTFADMQSIGSVNQIASSTGREFLGATNLLIFPDSQAQILTVAIYQNDGGAASAQVELLIPQFYANPTEYAGTHPAALQQLHPLRDMAGGTWTPAQYENEANRFCF